MWNNFFGSGGSAVAEKAKQQITATFENAGDLLTDIATSHVVKQREKEKLAAEQHTTDIKERQVQTEDATNKASNSGFSSFVSPFLVDVVGKQFFESTKNVIKTAGKSLQRFQTSSCAYYTRDQSLPLDTEALKDAEVVYITDRIITMGHPAMQSNTDGDITPQRKLAAVGHLLQKRHAGKYMVWNLSEVEYDSSVLEDQVLSHYFPGSPSPPLGLLLKLIFSMESWLKADKENVAVLHCLTGKGRTSTVLACFLCWTGEAGFTRDPMAALEYIALCKRSDNVDRLTIPSQRRYIGYFSNMLDGVRPHQPPLILRRIIMSEAPKYERDPSFSNRFRNSPSRSSNVSENNAEDSQPQQQTDAALQTVLGCSPYIQIFKAGKLILTAAASVKYSQDKQDLPFCLPSDGSITFPVEHVLQGDVLIRCRHLSNNGKRLSMFRAAFHTGYTPPKVMRLTKSQLDGACTDSRFSDDFFIDLVFEACDADMASKHLLSLAEASANQEENLIANETNNNNNNNKAPTSTVSCNEAEIRRSLATVQTATLAVVSASTYDTMLHRDSRFWDIIEEKRSSSQLNNSASSMSRYGPTIGHRRNSTTLKMNKNKNESSTKLFNPDAISSEDGHDVNRRSEMQKEKSIRRTMDTFTIGGGDFDLPSSRTSSVSEPLRPKKDELMEALMALDDDRHSHDEVDDYEDNEAEGEIIFEADAETKNTTVFSEVVDWQVTVTQQKTKEANQLESENLSAKALLSENNNTDVVVEDKGEMANVSNIVIPVTEQVATSSAEILDNDMDDIDAMLEESANEGSIDFEENDDELEDLEKFLTQSGK